MSTYIKLSKPQISKITQSGGFFGFWSGNLGKNGLTNIAIPLANNNLPELVTHLSWSAINKFGRKTSGKGAVRAEKGFTLFIPNEDVNDVIQIIKLLESSSVLIDGVTETVKQNKKQEGRFLGALLAPLATSLVMPVISSVVKGITRREVRRAGRGYINKSFSFDPSLNKIDIANYFKYGPRFNSVFSIINLPRIKDGSCVINLDDKDSKGTHWVSLFIDRNIAAYFDSFRIEYITQEVLNKIRDKEMEIITNFSQYI